VPTPAEVKAERVRQGLTQTQAAAKIGASGYRTWQNYETEKEILESGKPNNSRDMPHEQWTIFVSGSGSTN
jgi:DNA-binding XRE family transcriptional regulator